MTVPTSTLKSHEAKKDFMKGIIRLGVAIVASSFALAAYLSPADGNDDEIKAASLELAIKSFVGPAACLSARITLTARFRKSSPQDIDGSAVNKGGTEGLRHKQAALQNTLEQTCLAFGTYLLASVVLARYRFVIPTASAFYVVGRLLFYQGIGQGMNTGRGLGFALTYLPTQFLLVTSVAFLLLEVAQSAIGLFA